ncbi:MAG: ATPase, histidine kinase, gyrase and HSP90-like domain protein [Eubacterium sp.]|nr:ATPase, histidine kinase, gyrase and HSP90-like domain protein [Eubacterium sp.]
MNENIKKSEQMNLTVSARLFAQLGEQLISDELVALMELIKNAYDADATEVKVNVDTNVSTQYGIGKITISDNGNGMIPSIIRKGFLRLSTNFKKENKLTPFFSRRVLGEKGLGRLSFQRLGHYVKVITNPRYDRLLKIVSEEEIKSLFPFNQFEIDLDWDKLMLDVDLNEIQANVDSLKVERPKLGSVIEILGIKNLNFWNLTKTEEVRVKNEILGMVNPFVKGISNFQIYIDINGSRYSNENIDENVISKISDSIVHFTFENWILNVCIEKKLRYAKRQADKLINDLKEHKFSLQNIGGYAKYDIPNQYKIDLADNAELTKKYPYLKNLKLDKLITGNDAYPGHFRGVIYAADFSQENRGEFTKLAENYQLSEDIKTYNELRTVWEAANGIFIFRNEFRILPYGRKDWIGFTKKSQTYKYNIFKEHTTAGYITLDGQTSECLVEQTNRQGIVEDEYGKNFFKILKEVLLEVIVRDDVNFRADFTAPKPKENQEFIESLNGILKFKRIIDKKEEQEKTLYETKKAADNAAKENEGQTPETEFNNLLSRYFNDSELKNILNNTDTTIRLLLEAILDSLKKGKQTQSYIVDLKDKINKLYVLDKEVKQKNEQEKYFKQKEVDELYGLLPMVGQGIIVEALTHELNRIDEHIKSYASKSKDLLIKQPLMSIDDVINNQQLIINETAYLREQLNHLEPTYRKNNKLFEKIDIIQFIKDTYINNGPMSRKALNNGVSIELTGRTFRVETNKGYLITILDNLFLNSLYWLEESSQAKKIYFEVYNDGKIVIFDSGPGIHRDIENKLFMPFESMKKDGRGLGLYIVKELLLKLDADIYLDETRRNGQLYKFVIKFNNILEG